MCCPPAWFASAISVCLPTASAVPLSRVAGYCWGQRPVLIPRPSQNCVAPRARESCLSWSDCPALKSTSNYTHHYQRVPMPIHLDLRCAFLPLGIRYPTPCETADVCAIHSPRCTRRATGTAARGMLTGITALTIRKQLPFRSSCSRQKHREAIEIPYVVDHRVRREPQRLTSNDPIETARQNRLASLTLPECGQFR
jgi:hypothetical protein